MWCSFQGFGEQVSLLVLSVDVGSLDEIFLYRLSNEMTVNFYVLGTFMKYRIGSNLYS